MKQLLFFLLLITARTSMHAQGGDTINKKTILQLGYVSEYIDGKGPGLSGFEAQVKFLFGKHKLAKGEQLDVVTYFNLGYTYFPSTGYSLGQANMSLGLNTPAPIFGRFLRMDIGLGVCYYHGTIGEKSWVAKKPDLGGYAGLSIPFGRRGGIYGKFWLPGAISMLSDNSYIPPTFITAGIEF